ncbi:unnamed protein product [Lactuca virosa]|uniref:Uncharacterized protein n=1 Tax=Lactuca virosa TaxID=75947 RepID=A0AAU9PE54_9ASTR|nr:unnamed protein product [Lactuca virosa]
MIDYLSKVENFFWDNYEDEELIINGSNVSILDQALRLLDIAESKGKDTVNLEISTSEELKQLFHFDETINVIEETSDKETFVYISEEEVESLSSDIEPNFGMNKTEPHFDHPGESSFQSERTKRPKIEQGHRTGSMPDLPTGNPNQFRTNVLNIDNIETNRKEVMDRWTSEISLIIQTNKEKYATKESILLLFDHKTSGIVQNFIKNTNWICHNPMIVFQDMLDAIYMMFLGIDLIEDKANETKREIEKTKSRLTNLTICDICFLDHYTCDYETNLYKIFYSNLYLELIKQYLLKIPIVRQQSHNRFITEST